MPILQSDLVEKKFTELHGLYTAAFLRIKKIVHKKVLLEKLKAQIGDQYPVLKEDIESACTNDEVMDVFREKQCKFPNFLELRGLLYGLHLDKAVKEVDKFEEKREQAYEMILAKDFAKIKLEAYDSHHNVKVGNNVRLKLY